jgi:hypothetical protein
VGRETHVGITCHTADAVLLEYKAPGEGGWPAMMPKMCRKRQAPMGSHATMDADWLFYPQ